MPVNRYCRRSNLEPKTGKAFTLIELLVVISIIAMLLAIVIPSFRAAKKKAQEIICKTNLHQWVLCYQLYANDYEGQLPKYWGGTLSVSYMESLRSYYENINKMRTCPSAKKPSKNNPTGIEPLSFFGSTYNAWRIDPVAVWLADDDWGIGSFTENSWIRESDWSDWNDREWVSFSKMKSPSEVPFLLDGRWHDSHVESIVPQSEPTEVQFYNINNWSTMRAFMMRRHGSGINAAMADMSTIHVAIEDLWTLKWHKQFEKKTDIDLKWLKDSL